MANTSQPLPYTTSPYLLALADLILWARITFVWPPWKGIPSIVLPILPFRSGPLDELYPTPANLYSIFLQLILTTVQALFLISLPVSAFLGIGFPFLPPIVGAYVPVWSTWVLLFILLNRLLSNFFLNGTSWEFHSQTVLSVSEVEAHADEKWVFVNGVAAGAHWMQSNLDRLALTFRREIQGIHNPTRGILFDLVECILERTFSYVTPSTRTVYACLLDIVSNARYTKIILILHSQGAIEGGLALDWLFATVPAEQLRHVEVYTFGSAANHFNNPVATTVKNGTRVDVNSTNGSDTFQRGRILQYIEHYANSDDYVAKFGILNFRPLPETITPHLRLSKLHIIRIATNEEIENRYVGRLFIRQGSGHQLNGNYLDDFFPMDSALTEVLDGNQYMGGVVNQELLDGSDIVVLRDFRGYGYCGGEAKVRLDRRVVGNVEAGPMVRVKDVSRLWMYRNGMSPSA